MENNDGKVIGIVSHITLIGWIVALIMNQNNKSEFGSFYIRQNLGLILFSFITAIPYLGWVIGIILFVFWIISLISAIQGKMIPIPLIGEKFQEWFKSV